MAGKMRDFDPKPTRGQRFPSNESAIRNLKGWDKAPGPAQALDHWKDVNTKRPRMVNNTTAKPRRAR